MVKSQKEAILIPLSQIYMTTYFHGMVQALKNWKYANVAPTFKKGEKYKPVNYRP